jgi:predicted DNA-binding transcriptional regulator AlpA
MTGRFESVAEVAKRLGVGRCRINALLAQGRFPGAFKVGRVWVVPRGATPTPVPRGRPKEDR